VRSLLENRSIHSDVVDFQFRTPDRLHRQSFRL
jgi:hypothetical protein